MASQIALAIAEKMASSQQQIEATKEAPKNAMIKASNNERPNVETICQVTEHGDSESTSSFEQVH